VRIDWLRQAAANVDEIKSYIARDNPTAATKVAQRIVERTEALAEFPYMGRLGRVAATRELVVSGTPYIVVYRVAGEVVQIIRVLHGAQQWPTSF
jgi:toxin ParE1/3/4